MVIKMKKITAIATSIIPFLLLNSAFASSVDLAKLSETSKVKPNSTAVNDSYAKTHRNGVLLPGEVDIKELLPQVESDAQPPYGANVFAGGYETERVDGLNDNYAIAPGDKINIWLWGAVEYTDLATVDNQGNIFVPNIGPISVGGVKANKVNDVVKSKIRSVYTKNVSVYVNLLTATPISVYIAGSAIRPGQYAGMASDSLLYFLKRAGGIDSDRGSYRDISILRNGEEVATIDLYDFMTKGLLESVNFQDEDTIFIHKQKSTISVMGDVKNPFKFELNSDEKNGERLTYLASPLAKVSHVGVVGTRSDGPFSIYIPYSEFADYQLQDGDKVIFNADLHAQVLDIQLSGSYLGPSYYAVQKKSRLHELLQHVEVENELANYESIYILRKSVAQRQKQMIEESLNRLERSVFTAPASSDGEAAIRAQEAQMVMQFAEKARRVQPLGKVVVADNGQIANILLEQGDIIVIPPKSDLIEIGGEVLMPQAVVYNPNATLDDYIAWAGGFSDRADDERIAIVRANGLVDFNGSSSLNKGDQILVLPKVDTKTMQAVKDITQIIYQIAVAANVVVN